MPKIGNNKKEVIKRFDTIVNLWVSYHNTGKFPDVFGREFFLLVGDIIQGVPLNKLEAAHIDSVCEVVNRGKKPRRNNGS